MSSFLRGGQALPTLVDVLQRRAADLASKTAFTFLSGDGAPSSSSSFADLDRRARAIAVALLEQAKPGDRVCQEEVFGPFVTVVRFSTDEEALAIANSTEYGLGSGLWTKDLSRAHKMADAIHAGMCWINCYKRVSPGSPFGGVGQSGYGREMGFEAIHDYTEARSVWVNVDAKIPPHFKR